MIWTAWCERRSTSTAIKLDPPLRNRTRQSLLMLSEDASALCVAQPGRAAASQTWGKAPQQIISDRIQQLSDHALAQELEAVLTELRAMGSEVVPHYEIEGTEETEEGMGAAPSLNSLDGPKKH